MTPIRKGLPPALVLFCLSPALAEMLSGSAPPAEFFRPASLLVLGILYGGGAILCREAVRGWGKGWLSLLTLGAAYGILEEGLMVKSFFDPNWMDLGLLGTYGRWAGVNWVWSVHLTLYHAVFSIALPVLLVESIYAERRRQAWVSPRFARALGILLALDVAFGFLALTPYRPHLVPYVLAAIAAFALVRLARRVDDPVLQGALPRPRSFYMIGLLGTLGLFAGGWLLPNLPIPAAATILAMLLLTFGVYRLLRRWAGRQGGLPNAHRLSLAAGALSFFIVLAPLQEVDITRPDNTQGMAWVGLAGALFLLWLWRRLRRTEARRSDAAPLREMGASRPG
jgi:hypothetical protein